MSLAATFLALSAILLWSFLAYFGASFRSLPPLFVVGVALCVSGLAGSLRWREWRLPWRTWAVGVGGIFGYHFLYFSAFQRAPAVEVNLINYLWPLLIVLLSPLFLPNHHLRSHHLLGALIGLAGATLILSGGRFRLDLANMSGYLLAAGAALTWACYSLLTKRLPPFSTAAVGGFCLLSGALSLSAFALSGVALDLHKALVGNGFSLLLMGLGPMGLAFFAWDAALKRGDPRVIGSLSYLTPLLSTFNLILLGGQKLNWVSGVAMTLIVGGAAIGSLDLWKKSSPEEGRMVREGGRE
jgi:drug/metabolite transporter (DMT)-like permease